MNSHPTSVPGSEVAIGGQPGTGALSRPLRGPAAASTLTTTDQAAEPTAAQVIADLWADLDAHARLRQGQESLAAMQSRQRFD